MRLGARILQVCTVPLTVESCQNLWQHIPKDCKRPNIGMPNTMLEQYGEMLQQNRLALEARCGEGNVTAAAFDIEFVKVCWGLCCANFLFIVVWTTCMLRFCPTCAWLGDVL